MNPFITMRNDQKLCKTLLETLSDFKISKSEM